MTEHVEVEARRGSEYQSFLNCRQQWYLQWVEGIEPKRPDGKLFFGTLFHKWLEYYYNEKCVKHMADMLTTAWFNEQDVSAMEQTDIDDMLSLARNVASYYHETYGESDKDFHIIATELEFIVMIEEGKYMTGTIDLVYEVDGKIRFADHKTVSSIPMYEDKAQMDRQISRYWWVLQKLCKGEAFVKDRSPGTDRWIAFPDLIGKEIDGFDYNLIAKDSPKEPKVLKLKKGQTVPDLSKDKSQKTTYARYLAKIEELNLDVSEYMDMLNMLIQKPDPFLKRLPVLRSQHELEAAITEFAYTEDDIQRARKIIKEDPLRIEAVTYRNIGTHCTSMCNYKTLCQTTINGGHVSMVKNLGYKKREDK